MIKSALLILEDGTKFYGNSIGVNGKVSGEIVFNTSITGYQEIITDPSYYNQILVFTYPHIGNVGINKEDNESSSIQIKALIIRELSIVASNYRSIMSLSEYLKKYNIIGISGIDTRKLTHLLRNKGTQKGVIISGNIKKYYLTPINNLDNLNIKESTKIIGTTKKYTWNENVYNSNINLFTHKSNFHCHIVVYDYGVKYNILRILTNYNFKVTVVPKMTSFEEILIMKPDGIVFSNGPGNPYSYNDAIGIIKNFTKNEIPLFGICLGHQLLALSYGVKIIKMKFGHHGSNHPVKNLQNNTVMITAQNHGFIVDKNTLPNELEITHISLFDNTVQGLRHKNKPILSFQGHPEASPGPNDAKLLFNNFSELVHNYHLTLNHVGK